MRKVKFVSVFVLLVLLLSAGQNVGRAGGQPSTAMQNPASMFLVEEKGVEGKSLLQDSWAACSNSRETDLLADSPISDWQLYQDADYGFALEYPKGWGAETTIQQPTPLPDPFAIVKRQAFSGPEGLIELDMWSSGGRDFRTWLEWYANTRRDIPLALNAKVAGQPTVVFVEDGVTVDMLTAFFSDGQYVYRLWYTITRDERGAQTYWHMLDTFTLPGGRRVTAQIPEDVKQNTQRAIDSSAIPGILVASCCGYSDAGNPFPCCDNKGNCTWWVFYHHPFYVPFRGDAGTWKSQVPDYYGWAASTLPPENKFSIAWWGGDPGHVADTEWYTGGDDIFITEMFWCTSCFNSRTISIYRPDWYLFYIWQPQP